MQQTRIYDIRANEHVGFWLLTKIWTSRVKKWRERIWGFFCEVGATETKDMGWW